MLNRKQFRRQAGATMAALLLSFTPVSSLYALFEDPEAVYLDKIPGLKPIELEVVKVTAVYANRNRNGYFANFTTGEKVQLLAYHEKTSFVKNLKSNKTGWVPVEHLSQINESLLNSVLSQAAEQKKYQAAIEEKKVLAGMTLDQVRESLGNPDEAAFRTDATGRTDVWSYFEYKSVYREQTYTDRNTGQLVVRRFKEKVPEAETTIEFLNGRVTAIEKKRVQ
ncbi:MAG: hypothetical protein AAF649_06005 [Verrucomicrobiota bacterium]